MTRPNILWISTHDISPHLGAYAGVYPGADYAITPAVDDWQAAYGDLGLIPEDELAEQCRPAGVERATAPPAVEQRGLDITAHSATHGARIVWTADPPAAGNQQAGSQAAEGQKQHGPGIRSQRRQALCAPDGRAWKILCDATPAPANTELWFKACRLGYSDSREVRLAPAPAG